MGLLSLSASTLTKLGSASSLACMFEYDASDHLTSKGIAFQYFPETITDTKAVNYQTREIPEGSLPLYQWISSGERIISFTAYFTSDVDLGAISTQSSIDGTCRAAAESVSTGVGEPKHRREDLHYSPYAVFYFLPISRPGPLRAQPLTNSPQKLMLVFSGTGLGMLGGFGGDPDDPTQSAVNVNVALFPRH